MSVGCWAVGLSQGLKLFVFEEWAFAAKPLWVASVVAANFGGYKTLHQSVVAKTIWTICVGGVSRTGSNRNRTEKLYHSQKLKTAEDPENQSQASTAKSLSHDRQCCNLNCGGSWTISRAFPFRRDWASKKSTRRHTLDKCSCLWLLQARSRRLIYWPPT